VLEDGYFTASQRSVTPKVVEVVTTDSLVVSNWLREYPTVVVVVDMEICRIPPTGRLVNAEVSPTNMKNKKRLIETCFRGLVCFIFREDINYSSL
jgi:uncharacterized UPF0146 family protein